MNSTGVLFFDNRLEFLVAATIIEGQVLIIDALDQDGSDMRWLYSKLTIRGLQRRVNFIGPHRFSENRYLKEFSIVSDMAQLKLVCPSMMAKDIDDLGLNASKLIAKQVEKRLRKGEFDLLLSIYNEQGKHALSCSKQEASRIYYIRKKLSLESSSELKQLILFLSDFNSLRLSERKGINSNLNKKVIWSITKTQASL